MSTPLRLLLVEDNPDDAFLVQRQLRNADFDLDLHRVDSPESFRLALQDRSWDLILSDYQMPGFSGFAALEILRKSGLDIPFMLVSGAIGEHIAVEAMRKGARDYLLKDNLARLAPAIHRELLESSERQARRKAELRQKTLEGALQAILKGTSSEIGVGFFRSLVETLASSLQVKGALIAEYEKRSSTIRILAVHGFENPVPGQELAASGTLGQSILANGHVMMQNMDFALFVDGTSLKSMGIRSVIGLRLDSREGQPQGLLLVLDDKEIEEPDLTQDLISIFASRAGSELDRLDAERQRLSIEKQLLHSQKLEAVGTLAGGVAHDINNILTSIWGHAQLLEMRFTEGPGTDSIQGILKGCRRARDLARQILLFSRKQEPELHPVHLGEIIDETWKLLRATFPSSLRMKFDIEPNLPPVLGESSQLHQVLMNLCTNACHAMGSGGGTLTVSANRFSDSSDRMDPVPQIELLVTDTGSGIPSDIMPRIFEPFFTTKGPGIGTGLGLSVVHGIVQNHKGSITVSSDLGRGTTFKILLPCLTQEISTEIQRRIETKPVKIDKAIMVVDDEDAVADVLYHLLAVLGYKSEIFMNPLKALEAFKVDPSKWAAIISDYTMPDLSGEQFVGAIRAIRPNIPFLLTSGYENHGQSDSIARLGISCFIPKPFQADDLARNLANCLSAASE